MKEGTLKILGIAAGVVSAGATILGAVLSDKQQDVKIGKAVEKALTKKNG